jgi:hypothetical protein
LDSREKGLNANAGDNIFFSRDKVQCLVLVQLGLTQAQQQVVDEQAQIDLTQVRTLAKLYAQNPSYVTLQIALANAQAIKETDKMIFTPEGVFPNLIFNNGAVPSFNVTNP